jgi:hypothetical protein
MAKAGALKEKAERLKKKLADGKEKMDAEKVRALRKRIKRAQRRHRSLLKMEERAKKKSVKAAEEKKEEGAAAPA